MYITLRYFFCTSWSVPNVSSICSRIYRFRDTCARILQYSVADWANSCRNGGGDKKPQAGRVKRSAVLLHAGQYARVGIRHQTPTVCRVVDSVSLINFVCIHNLVCVLVHGKDIVEAEIATDQTWPIEIQVCPKNWSTPTFLFFSDGIGTRKTLFDPGGVWILRVNITTILSP